ncbi:MAG: DUF378 domain-containing protein [Christensenellales bacterium]
MMIITIIATLLIIIGAFNWFAVGVFGFNVINWICMGNMIAQSIIYGIVGIAGLWVLVYLIANKFKLTKSA